MSIQRRKSRQIAFQALYQNNSSDELTDLEIKTSISKLSNNPEIDTQLSDQEKDYCIKLVKNFYANKKDIDTLIETHSINWKTERMSTVALNVMRVAIVEMLHHPEVPNKVSVNEAIELSKLFGEKTSPAFINGILDKILKTKG